MEENKGEEDSEKKQLRLPLGPIECVCPLEAVSRMIIVVTHHSAIVASQLYQRVNFELREDCIDRKVS